MIDLIASLLPCLAPAGDGFSDLVPDLEKLRERTATREHVVSDERVREIEQRLDQAFDVPDAFGISLSRGTMRHPQDNALKHGYIRASLMYAPLGKELCNVSVYLDGDQFRIGGTTFIDPETESPRLQEYLESGKWFTLSEIPGLFRNWSEQLKVFEGADVEFHKSYPGRRLKQDPRFVTTDYSFISGNLEAVVHATLRVVDGGVAPAQKSWSYREVPQLSRLEVGPVASWRPLQQAIANVAELQEKLRFDVPHRVSLRGLGAHSGDHLVMLFPEREAHDDGSIQVVVWRDPDDPGRWMAMESSWRLREEAVELGIFVALTNKAFAVVAERDESLGVYGVSFDEERSVGQALVASVPKGSIWTTEKGRLHVLECAEGGEATVAEHAALRDFVNRASLECTARSQRGHAFRFGRRVFLCDEPGYDEQLLIKYRELAAPFLGGHGAKGPPP